jgi:hypothetical protein
LDIYFSRNPSISSSQPISTILNEEMDPLTLKKFTEIKNGTLQEIANFFNSYPELVGHFTVWYLEDRLSIGKSSSQSAPMDRVLQMFNWIIMGGSPTETLEQMKARGELKTSVCGNVWRVGGGLMGIPLSFYNPLASSLTLHFFL